MMICKYVELGESVSYYICPGFCNISRAKGTGHKLRESGVNTISMLPGKCRVMPGHAGCALQ